MLLLMGLTGESIHVRYLSDVVEIGERDSLSGSVNVDDEIDFWHC